MAVACRDSGQRNSLNLDVSAIYEQAEQKNEQRKRMALKLMKEVKGNSSYYDLARFLVIIHLN